MGHVAHFTFMGLFMWLICYLMVESRQFCKVWGGKMKTYLFRQKTTNALNAL